jgi:NAD(P)-dependent dehydrogenase (short-subunit alcohol dehydrogenase family)
VKVKDSAAVVVGGASGMGRATAERLAEQGARVAVLDLPTSEGAAAANELGAAASFIPAM